MFQAADRWATKQCEKQGLVADGQLKRRILGEEIIKSIRFPIMSAKEFADVVLDTHILHPNEIALLFKFFNSSLSFPLMFSKTPRQSRANRFNHRRGSFESLEDTCVGPPPARKAQNVIRCANCGQQFQQMATRCFRCGSEWFYSR